MNYQILQLLSRVRLRIRLFILAETVLVLVTALSLLFWLGLAIDWWLEPSRDVRVLTWLAVAAGVSVLLYRFLWQGLQYPLPDQNLALLVERVHPELRDRMLTAVAPVPATTSTLFLDAVRDETAQLSRDYSPAGVISLKALRPRLAMVILLLATIVVFAFLQREAFATWMDRLALSEARWPRRVNLIVEGFELDGQGRRVRSIPRFESAELVVLADLSGSFEAPAEVQIRYRTPDNKEERASMARIGDAKKGRDATQAFRFQFPELREPLKLEVRGGDDRLTNLFIDVLPRPRIASLEINAEYPAYLQMSPRRLTATSVVTVPIGTTLKIEGLASQPLKRVEASTTLEGLTPQVKVDEVDRRIFRLTLENLPGSGDLSLLPVDLAGVTAREPYRSTVVAQADELPTATARLIGIGAAVTPEARLPIVFRAEDDHAIDRMWLELLVDGQLKRIISTDAQRGQPTANTKAEVDLTTLVDLESNPLMVQPNQKLSLVGRAQDAWDLTDESRIGSTRLIALEVVSADKLLEILEREEINLRRTFERVIEKTVQSRDKFGQISLAESTNEALQSARIHLARVLDDINQVTDETLSISTGFQLIHDQLVNNRVGDEELKSRLRERIAQPLRAIADRELRALATAIDDAGRLHRPTDRDIAVLRRRTGDVVDQMALVLAEMKSLETYSEVVAMLRKLIREQQVLTEKTRHDQREQLKTLLED